MPLEARKFWQELEGLGEDEVRLKVSQGVYGEKKLALVNEWLRRKEQSRQRKANAQQKRLKNSEWIALGALAVSIAAFGKDYLPETPSSHTIASVSQIQWNVGSGRFGTGPYPVLRMTVANKGNRALTIEKMHIRYGMEPNGSDTKNCDSESDHWSGLPWNKFVTPSDVIEASPLVVIPSIPSVVTVNFEPIDWKGLLPKPSATGAPLVHVCLSVTARDTELTRMASVARVGTLKTTQPQTIDFQQDGIVTESFVVWRDQ